MSAAAYLRKAHESLASAGADSGAGRYNSAANRAYYAAFQAAVALLITEGIQPRTENWEHRFVIAQFSSTLIRRRKRLPARFKRTLNDLLEVRLTADYRVADVSARQGRAVVQRARELVEHLAAQSEG